MAPELKRDRDQISGNEFRAKRDAAISAFREVNGGSGQPEDATETS